MSAITVPNTGRDAKAWWWYHGVSFDQLMSLVEQHNARIVDIELGWNGSLAAVMVSNTGASARP